MALYAWTATDAAGKTRRGTQQAEGQKQVRQWLREQKLMPVSITETREKAESGKAKTGAKLSTPVLSMFTRQLSTLVNAALGSDKTLIESVRVFDQFTGEKAEAQMGAGKKSIALTVRLQPTDKTLTEADIDAVSKKVIEKVTKATGGALRG